MTVANGCVSPLFERMYGNGNVPNGMGMSLSVLRIDRFTSPIPIPRQRSFVSGGSGPNGNGDRSPSALRVVHFTTTYSGSTATFLLGGT